MALALAVTVAGGAQAPQAIKSKGKSPLNTDAAEADAKAKDPTAAKPAVVHTGRGRVYDEKAGLSFVPPAAWTKGDPPAHVYQRGNLKVKHILALQYFGPIEDELRVNVIATVAKDDGTSFKQFREAVKVEMLKKLPSWKMLSDGTVQLQDRSAYYWINTFTIQGHETQQIQYMLRGDVGKIYTVTFTASKASFPKYNEIFEDCANTIRCD
jgi:hypothetical protein